MEIVDVHVHALPRGDMNGGEVDAHLETVLHGLHAHGIRRAILVPINDLSWQPVAEMNDFAEAAVRAHDGLAGFVDLEGFIDLDLYQAHYGGIQRIEDDVARRCANGLRGIKVHLQNLGLQASDWRLLPLYRLAGELQIPVMIHCHPGSSPGTVDNSHPAEIEKMVRAFHKTTFIISHLGGILYLHYMPWLVHDNVYFDTSGIMDQLVAYYGPDRVRYILDQIGYDRLLFGSDYPVADIDAQLAALRQVVPPAHHERVLAHNALHLGTTFRWWT
jgi:predicted TIM-barrel fold metal-dependent hydrolase